MQWIQPFHLPRILFLCIKYISKGQATRKRFFFISCGCTLYTVQPEDRRHIKSRGKNMASSEQLPIYRAAAIANVQLTYKLKFDLQWSNQQCTNAYLYQYPTGGWDQPCYRSQRSWPLLTSRRKVGRESAFSQTNSWERKTLDSTESLESFLWWGSSDFFWKSDQTQFWSCLKVTLSFTPLYLWSWIFMNKWMAIAPNCWFSASQGWGWGLAFYRRA